MRALRSSGTFSILRLQMQRCWYRRKEAENTDGQVSENDSETRLLPSRPDYHDVRKLIRRTYLDSRCIGQEELCLHLGINGHLTRIRNEYYDTY
jgi:hypothetical protein